MHVRQRCLLGQGDVLAAQSHLTIGRIRGEHLIEMFYNYKITPWLWLTGDLQLIRPTRPNFRNAVAPGARLEIRFFLRATPPSLAPGR